MYSRLIKFTYCISLLLLISWLPASAQINIVGKAMDETDDTPLPGASVYFNNTTIGTYTNVQGDFYFRALRLPGTELVVFCPGYELLVFKPIAEQVDGKRIILKLRKNEPLANSKMVGTDATRKRLMSIFKENFLGFTEEAIKAAIVNENDIHFKPWEGRTSFAAYTDTPLVIINTMLGYKISYNLVTFWYDDSSGQSNYSGYARYEELADTKKWIKNRQHAYYGSTLHFYRSLISNQLYEQGYGTFLLESIKKNTSASVPIVGIKVTTGDSMTVAPITAPEILYIDSTNNFSIRLTGRLLVQYNKDPYPKKFLSAQFIFPGKGVESHLVFNRPSIGINNAGVLSDAEDVTCSGYWLFEKLANKLPYDYAPH